MWLGFPLHILRCCVEQLCWGISACRSGWAGPEGEGAGGEDPADQGHAGGGEKEEAGGAQAACKFLQYGTGTFLPTAGLRIRTFFGRIRKIFTGSGSYFGSCVNKDNFKKKLSFYTFFGEFSHFCRSKIYTKYLRKSDWKKFRCLNWFLVSADFMEPDPAENGPDPQP